MFVSAQDGSKELAVDWGGGGFLFAVRPFSSSAFPLPFLCLSVDVSESGFSSATPGGCTVAGVLFGSQYSPRVWRSRARDGGTGGVFVLCLRFSGCVGASPWFLLGPCHRLISLQDALSAQATASGIDLAQDAAVSRLLRSVRDVAFNFASIEWLEAAPIVVVGLEYSLKTLQPGDKLGQLFISRPPSPVPSTGLSGFTAPSASRLSSPIVGPSVSEPAASRSEDPPAADLRVAPPSPPRLRVRPGPLSLPPPAAAASPTSPVVSVSSEKSALKPLKRPAGWQTVLLFAFLAIFF